MQWVQFFRCIGAISTYLFTEILLGQNKIGSGGPKLQNIGPTGPFFSENFGLPVKIMVRPSSDLRILPATVFNMRLIELDNYTKVGG